MILNTVGRGANSIRKNPAGKRIAILINNNQYHKGAEDEEKLPDVKTGAQQFHQLLKERYGYEMLTETILGDWALENKNNPMRILQGLLKKWSDREGHGGGEVDRLLLHYHGHGKEVLGHSCLLTPKGDAIPMVEVINKVTDYVKADRYYIIKDCCANKDELANEADKKRVEEAVLEKQNEKLKEKIVKIEAVPGGYEAHAIKTCTYALVSVLNSSYDAGEEGVPLKALRERLHKEHTNVESRNYPGVESSIISEVVDDFFPL